MKRILSVILFLFIGLSLSVFTVSADGTPCVVDVPGVLSYEQLEELEEELSNLQTRYKISVSVVIDEGFYSYDAQSSADDWYDDYGYGYGDSSDGILFYISVQERAYHFSTHGYGITAFTDDAIDYLKQEVELHLRANAYYPAIKTYLAIADDVLSQAEMDMVYSENDWTYVAVVIGGAMLISFLVAFVMMGIQLLKMNTAVSNDTARNYIKEGSFHLDMARDIFLYSRITKVKKENTDSSTHRSSSGRTHGGGGGSF